jgi:hypothetical protein
MPKNDSQNKPDQQSVWVLQITIPLSNATPQEDRPPLQDEFWEEIYKIIDNYPNIHLGNGQAEVARLTGPKRSLAKINKRTCFHTQKFKPKNLTK